MCLDSSLIFLISGLIFDDAGFGKIYFFYLQRSLHQMSFLKIFVLFSLCNFRQTLIHDLHHGIVNFAVHWRQLGGGEVEEVYFTRLVRMLTWQLIQQILHDKWPGSLLDFFQRSEETISLDAMKTCSSGLEILSSPQKGGFIAKLSSSPVKFSPI